MHRSSLVGAAVISAAAMFGVGAGVTTALVRSSVGGDSPAASAPTTHGSTSPTGPASPATPAALPPASSSTPGPDANALYYVDGTIHDGNTAVAYQPRFQTNVASLARTAAGWVVDERFGQDGRRLVLVGADGSTTQVRANDPHWYDVSPAGDAIAVPDSDDPGVVDVVDGTDGTVLSTLTSGYTRVVNALFTGEDASLVLLVTDAHDRETLVRYDTSEDRLSILRRVPGEGGTLVGVDEAGHRLLMEYLSGGRSCVAVLDLQRNARTLWRSCQFRPLGRAGVSPDGARVALASASDALGTVTALNVLDAATGRKTSSVRIDSGYRLIDATWSDPDHLVVQGTDDNFTSATLSLCTVGVRCDSVAGASPDDSAEDVAPGSTY